MKLRLAALALLPLALAACDETQMQNFRDSFSSKPAETAQEPAEPTPPQPPAVSPLKDPIELAGGAKTARATAQAGTVNVTALNAIGTEQDWSADVAGGKVVFKRAGAADVTVAVDRLVFAGGIEFIGVLGGRPFTLRASEAACTGRGGQKYPLSVTLRAQGNTLTGCGSAAQTAS
ncbi:MAG: hypothetical protein Q4G24_03080 [Paracoccus sp. (in: a-proteobacteria)]|uniref:hypothetical protein n=1 Tax=Paracoccus sp. TaxID=267 RepID=UPI0026DF205C|nr:hypothetical protein [Paracoccus sp. (in: a-proteobacteria)]MDO5620434.1 hypothetical protein [Paracoccus sp. (in: a-proteobacteria)]